MNKSKAAIIISQIIEKIQLIGGGFWTFIFALALMGVCIDDPESETETDVGTVVVVIILLLIGIFTIWCGLRRKKLRLLFKEYVSYLSVNPMGDLDDLAASTGTAPDTVKKNIRFMIKKHFFVDAYIDEDDNQLVLASARKKQGYQKELVFKACRCPYCDGSNLIAEGTAARCDYCGSFLQG